MKKLIGVSFAVLVSMILFRSASQAAQAVRSPKEHIDLNFTTVWSTASVYPGALYAVILGSGNAQNDYVVCKDTNTAIGLNSANTTSATLGPRIYFSSMTYSSSMSTNGNVNFVFDPPLVFFNGMVCALSSASDQATVVFEQGRGLSGQ